MKTKTFLLLCLLLGMGFTQLSAQSVNFTAEWDYAGPIYCDGAQVDYVTGTAIGHYTLHYKNGVLVWLKLHSTGEATGTSGEVFTIHNDIEKEDFSENICTYHFNLDGENGTHYIGSYIWDWENDPYMENMVIEQSICLDN